MHEHRRKLKSTVSGDASQAAGLTALLMLWSVLAASFYNQGGKALQAVAQGEPDQHLTQWLCIKVMLAGSCHIHNQSHWRLCLQATWQFAAAEERKEKSMPLGVIAGGDRGSPRLLL